MLKAVALQIINDSDHIFTYDLNHHAPPKIKVIRGNHNPRMNKDIKDIMVRSKFEKKANKSKTTAGIAACKKQRNYIVRLNKESKHNYFDRLDKVLNGFEMFTSLIFF